MMGVGPWGHPGMMGYGPCGMMGRMQDREEMVQALILKMAKAEDSKKQIENNVRVALAYADRVEEAAREHRLKESLKEELKNAEGEVRFAEEELEGSSKDLARHQKEYKELIKKGPNPSGPDNQIMFCLERAQKEVPQFQKLVEEKRKSLKLLKERIAKAGLSFLLAEKK